LEKVSEMDFFPIILISTILVIAAVNDLRFQKIPNLLIYPTIIMAMAYHSLTNGLEGFLFSTEGLGLGVGILLLPYLMGGMGAGDAKLLGAVGSIIGPRGVLLAFLFTALVGGLYALVLLLVSHQSVRACLLRCAKMLETPVATAQVIPASETRNRKKPRLCYGVAIALGTLFSIGLELVGYRLLI
jgi:prepilin peptidase CpaA